MRLRTIKPGFFKNEDLAALPPLARILFAGLWCMADREGRMEDRPKRIKVEILPYDSADVEKLLKALADGGFIQRYESGGNHYIAIPSFGTHQNPHVKEANSLIPAPSLAGMVKAPDEHGADTIVSGQVLSLGSGVLSLGSCTSRPPGSPDVPRSPTRSFTDGWESLFAKHREGAKYAFEDAKDGANVKALLKFANGDVAEALRRAEVHLTDPFYSEKGANLSTFKAGWNRCVHGATNGNGNGHKKDVRVGQADPSPHSAFTHTGKVDL